MVIIPSKAVGGGRNTTTHVDYLC